MKIKLSADERCELIQAAINRFILMGYDAEWIGECIAEIMDALDGIE